MLNILNQFLTYIQNGFQYVLNIVHSITQLIVNIPVYISFITTNLFVLPSIVIPFVVASVSLYVVYVILGRNS